MLSRVADHLYWMGRYMERAEHTVRVLNVHTHLALEEDKASRQKRLQQVIVALRQPTMEASDFQEVAATLTLDPRNLSSVRACVQAARENARQIRERISSEMWEQINKLYLFIAQAEREDELANLPHEFHQRILLGAHIFNGLADSTMTRDQGWLFIQSGRWLERAGLLVSLLDTYLPQSEQMSYLDWLGLLKCCTAFEAYRKQRGVELDATGVIDFLVLSPTFPHSLLFSVAQLRVSLRQLAEQTDNRKTRELDRVLGKMHHDLEYARAEELSRSSLDLYFDRFRNDLKRVHDLLYRLYIAWEVEF